MVTTGKDSRQTLLGHFHTSCTELKSKSFCSFFYEVLGQSGNYSHLTALIYTKINQMQFNLFLSGTVQNYKTIRQQSD